MPYPSNNAQRGAATLMTVLFLLVVVAFIAIVGLQIVGSDITDSSQQDESIAALFLGESGLEYATRFLQINGAAACTDGTLPTTQTPTGARGSFQVYNGFVTDWGGGPLGANECRVRATGVVNNVSRTVEAVVDFSGGGGAIAYDNSRSAASNNTSSINWNHNVGAGSNRFFIVGVSIRPNTASTGATYNGVPMTLLGSAVSPAPNRVRVDVYYLPGPATGNNAVVVNFPSNVRVVGGSVSLNGVDQSPPAWNSSNGSGWLSNPGITTTVDNSWLVETIAKQTNRSFSPLSGQTERWDRGAGFGPPFGANRVRGAGATRGPISPPAAVTNRWWSWANRPWAAVTVALGPATGGGAVLRWREIARP